jgi:hypothetical protein
LVEDISPGGAKLVIENGQPPDDFKLHFAPNATNFKNCVVQWRRPGCVGVQFVAASSMSSDKFLV